MTLGLVGGCENAGDIGDKIILNITCGSIDDLMVLLTHQRLTGRQATQKEIREQGMEAIIGVATLTLSKAFRAYKAGKVGVDEFRAILDQSSKIKITKSVRKELLKMHNFNVDASNEAAKAMESTLDNAGRLIDINNSSE